MLGRDSTDFRHSVRDEFLRRGCDLRGLVLARIASTKASTSDGLSLSG
jgi:hypothetical protein